MYALELFFDSPLNDYVKQVWKGLSEQGISSAMYDIADLRPHITVSVYQTIGSAAEYLDLLRNEMKDKKKLEVKFDILASFPTTGTCFLAPTITNDLFTFHRNYYQVFDRFTGEASIYYTPDRWNPHCSLAVNLTKEQLVDAFHFCLQDFEPIHARMESIGLVELAFKNGKCVGSPTVEEIQFV